MMKKTGMFSAAVLAVACGMAFAFAACQPESEEQKIPEPVITAQADKSEITAGEALTLTWSATENAQVGVSYTLDGAASDDLTFTSGTPFTIEVAGEYAFTFTAEGAEDVTVTVTVREKAAEPQPHVHTYGAWQVTKAPAMSAAGSAERTCTAEDCDDPATATETITLPALNTEGAYATQVKTAATCEAAGVTAYTYLEESISFDVETAALGHKYTAVTVVYASVKTNEAWTAEASCDNGCDKKLTLDMDAFDASEWTLDTEDGYTAPSHTADGRGNYVRTVEQDGYTVEVTVIGVTIPTDAKHTYAATYRASEYRAGETQIGCTFEGCEKAVTITLPALPETQASGEIWTWKVVSAPENGKNGSGTYTCTLEAGDESVAITVTDVEIKAPVITAEADKTEITAGEEVTLTYTATEEAEVAVSVVKDDVPIELVFVSGTAFAIEDEGVYVFTFTAKGAKDVTVTVSVKEKLAIEYTVAYAVGDHAANGTQAPAAQTVKEGAEIRLPDAPAAAEGYAFAGWSDGKTSSQAGASYTVHASTTFTAQWNFVGFTKEGDVFDIFGQAPVHPYTLEDGESLVFTADVSGMAAWEEGMFVRVDDGSSYTESYCFRPSNTWWNLAGTAQNVRTDLAEIPVGLSTFNQLKQDTRIVVTRSANDLSIAFDFGIIVVGYTIEGLAQSETIIYFFSFDDANYTDVVSVANAKVVWSETVKKPTPDPAIIATASAQEITAGGQVTLTWQSTHGAAVTVTVTKDGVTSALLPVSGTPLTIDEAGTYVFTFTAQSAEAKTIIITVKEPHVHTYGAWQVTKTPAMSAAGSAERTCTAEDCDDPATATEMITLPALNTEGAYATQVKTAATCEAAGVTTYTYLEEGISFDVETAALGHKYTAVTVAYASVKTNEAWTAEAACDNGCDKKLTLDMDAFDASEWTLDTEDGYTAPSHTADGRGNYVRTVEQDGYTVEVTVIGVTIPTDAKHTYAATYRASEYRAGETQIGCTFEGCEKAVTITLPALPETQASGEIWTWKVVSAPENGKNGSGTYTCTLEAGDESVAITVTDVEIKAPVITAEADKTEITAGEEVTLTYTATEEAEVAVSVVKDDVPIELVFVSGTAFAIEDEGVYVFTFTAKGAKDVTVTVTVEKPNLVMDEESWTLPATWNQSESGLINTNQNDNVVNKNWLSNYAVTKDTFSGDYSVLLTVQGTRTNHDGLAGNNIEMGLIPWYQDAQNYVIVYLQFWANWQYSNMGLTSIEVLYFKDGVQYGLEDATGFNSHFMDNVLYSGSNCASLKPDDLITIRVDRVYDAQQNRDVYTVTVSGTNSAGTPVSVSFEQAYSISVGKSGSIGLYSWNDAVTFSSLTVEEIEAGSSGTVEPEQPAVLPDDEDDPVPDETSA